LPKTSGQSEHAQLLPHQAQGPWRIWGQPGAILRRLVKSTMTHLNTSLTNICRKPALAGVVGIGFFVYAALTLERCGATSWGSWGLGGVLLAALFAIWRRLDFDAWLGGILSLAIAMCLTYATYTCLNERNYDGPDHFWYANFIAEHASIFAKRL